MSTSYPFTRKGEDFDEFFGRKVPDPYRWLEDDTSPEVEKWVKAQNEITSAHLSSIPFREGLRKRMAELYDYTKYSPPFSRGEWRYFFRQEGLQNQAVLWREKNSVSPSVFLDPNTFSVDGTTSLSKLGFSPDGSMAAYGISQGGADWQSLRVIRCDNPTEILETVTDVKFTMVSWRENEGFYYSCYEKPESGTVLSARTAEHKLMYHRIGTPEKEDELVFGGSETPRRYVNGKVTEDGRWLCITAAVSTTGNELYVQDLSKPGSPLVQLASGFENEYSVIDSEGEFLFILTNLNAPYNRLIQVDMSMPKSPWKDVIPERPEVLHVTCGGGFFFAGYLRDAMSHVEQLSYDGAILRTIVLPDKGTATGFSSRKQDKEIYYRFTSYTYPGEIWSLNLSTGRSVLFRSSGVKFDPSQYLSEQVFYKSQDGTSVPMMITRKRDLPKNGSNPCLLYGYGGFGVNLTPAFNISAVIWMEWGGVYAVPNIRGGGEYGEAWHLAGTRLNKQNVFDDFIAAAEFLIEEGYTSSEKLAVSGGSNGGLLAGAVLAQRPELFSVVLPAVGVLDMLRYHRFTAGAGWAYDYGTVEESPEMFEYLAGYSPLHNLTNGECYPAVLVTTGDHDDRVVPAHSFKFAARLQEAQGCAKPVLIRIDVKAGHGAGKPLSMIIDAESDRLAFALYHLGYKTI